MFPLHFHPLCIFCPFVSKYLLNLSNVAQWGQNTVLTIHINIDNNDSIETSLGLAVQRSGNLMLASPYMPCYHILGILIQSLDWPSPILLYSFVQGGTPL
jgi:hypothetical protein